MEYAISLLSVTQVRVTEIFDCTVGGVYLHSIPVSEIRSEWNWFLCKLSGHLLAACLYKSNLQCTRFDPKEVAHPSETSVLVYKTESRQTLKIQSGEYEYVSHWNPVTIFVTRKTEQKNSLKEVNKRNSQQGGECHALKFVKFWYWRSQPKVLGEFNISG
jgi:hypothetical protein